MPQGALPDVVPYHNPYGGWPGDPSWGTAGAVIPREIVVTRGEIATPATYEVTTTTISPMDIMSSNFRISRLF